jgi:hypothetical protein
MVFFGFSPGLQSSFAPVLDELILDFVSSNPNTYPSEIKEKMFSCGFPIDFTHKRIEVLSDKGDLVQQKDLSFNVI